MKTPFKETIEFNFTEDLQEAIEKEKPSLFVIQLHTALIRNEHVFPFLVIELEVTPAKRIRPVANGVLCQSSEEAEETRKKIIQSRKRHLVSFQCNGHGGVAWAYNYKRVDRQIISIGIRNEQGELHWHTVERDVDDITGEITEIRRQAASSQAEADSVTRLWYQELQQKALGNPSPPVPVPERASPLTESDQEDIAAAKSIALKRQWPKCFAIFEKYKKQPGIPVPDQDLEDAYLLDLVENGISPQAWKDQIRADLDLISALHRAKERYRRRSKSKFIDLAAYLIAFNWELGWCYLSDREICAKASSQIGHPFNTKQIKDLRYRLLGLIAKHPPGPDPRQ